jgi:predicted RNA binding protein YcfA (HicA-like mRNA interferase family)
MRNNPRDWRIKDLKVLATHFGIAYRQHGTSHVTFRHPEARVLLSVPAARPIKPVYIRHFLALIEAKEDAK